jgi:hypothetical protein
LTVLRCLTLIAVRDAERLPDDGTLCQMLADEVAARRHPDDLLVRLSDGGVACGQEWPWKHPDPLLSGASVNAGLSALLDRYRLRTTDADCDKATRDLGLEKLLGWFPARFPPRHAWAFALTEKGVTAAAGIDGELADYLDLRRLRPEQRFDELVHTLRGSPFLVDRLRTLLADESGALR